MTKQELEKVINELEKQKLWIEYEIQCYKERFKRLKKCNREDEKGEIYEK